MKSATLNKLHASGLINESQHRLLSQIYSKTSFSLYYELRTMLYFGVLLFTGGIGVLVYNNIDSIGHQIIILSLTTLMLGCFWYVIKKKKPYANTEVQSPGTVFDYILLLGSLLFAIIIGYVQFQYSVFGEHWELGALVPALVYFPLAYVFDHRGVLSLGITGVASWLGFSVSPLRLMKESIFPTEQLVYSGIVFGILVMGSGWLLEQRNIKKHFTFTYMIFGFIVFGAACLGGLFSLHLEFVYFLLIAGLCFAGVLYARREQSFVFLLLSSLFGYIALTYLLIDIVDSFLFWQVYFIISCAAMIYGLFKHKILLGK